RRGGVPRGRSDADSPDHRIRRASAGTGDLRHGRARAGAGRSGRRAEGVSILGHRVTRHPSAADVPADDRPDDAGTVLLLTVGYVVLALVLVLVCADATSLYLAQKRADAVADAAALAGADGFLLALEAGEASAELTDGGVRDQAADIVAAYDAVELVAA